MIPKMGDVSKRWRVLLLAVALIGVSCGPGGTSTTTSTQLTPVSLQLVWVTQTQFAGYFAANAQGYYKDEGLNVTIKPGGPDSPVVQLVASGNSQFGAVGLGSVLQARDQAINVVNIAQTQQTSTYRLVYFKNSGITSLQDLKGKKVGEWAGTSSALELQATFDKYGINPNKALTLVQQSFDMSAFLNKQLDAASATLFNEYAQVIAAGHSPNELGVINFDELGTGFEEDGLMVNGDYLKGHEAIAVKFIRATLRGYMYCRDNPQACVQIVLKLAPNLCPGLELWQMNEVNKSVWPSPNGVGYMPPAGFERTAAILYKYGGLKDPPSPASYRQDLWQQAISGISGDTKGLSFKPLSLGPSDLKCS